MINLITKLYDVLYAELGQGNTLSYIKKIEKANLDDYLSKSPLGQGSLPQMIIEADIDSFNTEFVMSSEQTMTGTLNVHCLLLSTAKSNLQQSSTLDKNVGTAEIYDDIVSILNDNRQVTDGWTRIENISGGTLSISPGDNTNLNIKGITLTIDFIRSKFN